MLPLLPLNKVYSCSAWVRSIVVFLIFCLSTMLTGCKEEKVAPPREVIRPVKMLTIESTLDSTNRSYPGRVRAAKRVDLAFQVGGPLIELLVDEGQEVTEGEVLARIDPRDFETDLRETEGQLAKGVAALSSAQSEYDRIKRIRNADPGAASESMLIRRQESVDTTTAEIASLTASREAAKNRLEDTYLKASFDGIVSRRYVDNFQEVQAQEPILSLDFLNQIEVVVDVPETIMATLDDNQKFNIYAEFASIPGRQFDLSTKEYSTRADANTQTYQVVFQMDRPQDINILPGMTATVKGSAATDENSVETIIIPAYSLFPGEKDATQVWVVNPEKMTVHQREIKTGELVGKENIKVLSGLKTGETIAVTGVNMLREGMKVRDLAQLEGYGK